MDKSVTIDEKVMEEINVHTVAPLTAEQVYCFCVLLCDNDVDRDFERFSVNALKSLEKLYIGRTGIFDHDPKGENQTARIYRTEVREYPDRKTAAGEVYTALMGYAYMVRTEENKSLIAEIDGGIKKEVSVGCSVGAKYCSICGQEVMSHACAHQKGKRYGERLCFHTLENPTDAYEWSFVAVPAQRNAGVTKKYGGDISAAGDNGDGEKVMCACENLREDILKLSYFTKPFVSAKSVAAQTAELDIYELLALKKSLEKQIAENEIREDFAEVRSSEENSCYTL